MRFSPAPAERALAAGLQEPLAFVRTTDNRRISLRFSKPGERDHETDNEKHCAHNQSLVAFYGRVDLVLARNQLTKRL